MITVHDHSDAASRPISTVFTTKSPRMKMARAEKLVGAAAPNSASIEKLSPRSSQATLREWRGLEVKLWRWFFEPCPKTVHQSGRRAPRPTVQIDASDLLCRFGDN